MITYKRKFAKEVANEYDKKLNSLGMKTQMVELDSAIQINFKSLLFSDGAILIHICDRSVDLILDREQNDRNPLLVKYHPLNSVDDISTWLENDIDAETLMERKA